MTTRKLSWYVERREEGHGIPCDGPFVNACIELVRPGRKTQTIVLPLTPDEARDLGVALIRGGGVRP